MERKKITHTQDPSYNAFEKIYKTAFPVFEQRTQAQQAYALTCPSYRRM